MSRPLAVLRPEPGWSASAKSARDMGLEVIGHPLFDAEAVAWKLPDGAFDALLVGSAAAFRLGGRPLAALTHLPVHAVGETTADAARGAGFTVARTGAGGLQRLLDTEPRPLRFLRLGGEERVELLPSPGQNITDCVLYRMMPRPMEAGFARTLEQRAPIVALHSAAAAEHFRGEIERLGIERGTLFALALAPRVAKAAGLGWAALHIADRPDDAALLAKAAALCK